jgi:hypothetical protein
MTLGLPFENRTRAPFELAWSPSPASITPAFTISSLYLAMSPKTFSSGSIPASDSLFALTNIMKRIGFSSILPGGFCPLIETSNERRGNRLTCHRRAYR